MTEPLWRRCAAPALLVLIVILFYWKLTLTTQYSWMESPDVAYLLLPWFQFQAVQWHHGAFPLWDPNGFAGQTLFGQAQPGAAYPPNWLLYLSPLYHGIIRERALDWYYVLIRCLAAVNCYALCRGLGRSRMASVLGGCVFALGGFIANITWPEKVNGAVWAPLVLLYLFRAISSEPGGDDASSRTWSNAALSGFFLGVTWLGGHHEAALFLSLAVIVMWACSKRVWLAALSLVVAGLAGGFQTIPLLEYGARAARWIGLPNDPLSAGQTVPYTNHMQYSLKPISLFAVFLPHMDDDPSNPFVGIVALSLAVLGAILAWRERRVRWLAALALGGILFALGGNSIFHGVMYAVVPLVDKARSPSMALSLLALGLAPLAAFGLDALALPSSFRWSQRAGRVLAGMAVLMAAVSLVLYLVKVEPAISDNRLMITALCAILGSALLASWRANSISARAGGVAAVALILFELANVTTYWLPHKSLDATRNAYLRRFSEHTDIAAFLRGVGGEPARIEYDDQVIPYNFGDWFGLNASGLDTFTAYLASVPVDLWQLNLFSERGQDFLGIKYYLGKTPNPLLHRDQREVFQGSSGVKVFENLSAYPRAWAVHEAIALPAGMAARDALNSPQFDPLRTAFVRAGPPPKLEQCDSTGDSVRMPLHAENSVRITAHLACRGMVVLTDSWFPGWRASVDGRAVPIDEVDGAVRGVTVDTGDHVVEMSYRPWSVILGGAMSLFAVALVVLIRRREHKN
jgi:hypothetical protein